MDFTLKNKSWAGNIYHQFESICQDVDDFMSKDTVRFVENHVQSVGISVKRLYSNVVQDILPPSVDIAKHESQATDGEQASTVNAKQLSENQGSADNFRNSDASMPIEVDSVVDENITRVSIPLAAYSISDDVIISGTSDEECKNYIRNMHEERLITVAMEIRDFNDTECLSNNTSSSNLLFESKLRMVEDLNSDENGSLSDPTVASSHKDGTLCDISSKDVSFDVLSSVQLSERACVDISCDEEEEKEMGKRSSSCLMSPNSSNILDSISANFIERAESVCQSHVESNGSDYETKAVDVLPDFLIFESHDNAFPMDGSDLVGGLSEIEMSRQSETGSTYEFVVGDDDINMETVDLSHDVKHDETSVILNGNSAHAASHGKRNFRYYKKLIQDALTSRKRLSTEYEHLAILYGDINSEQKQHFEPISVPSSANTSIHTVRTESFHEMSETEWELV